MFKILLKTFILFNCAFAQEWPPPYFESNPEISFILTVDEDRRSASIQIDENIDYNITIAYYTYSGSTEPETQFVEGDKSSLGLQISRNNNNEKWAVIITKPQDYEKNSRNSFITTLEEINFTIYVLINNLDDEKPIIELTPTSTPCIIRENEDGLTNCTIQITDQDGLPDNLKYDISSTVVNNVKDIFRIKNYEVESGAKTLTTILEVLKEVDYEQYPSYILQFTVTDSGSNSDSAKIIIQVEDLPDTIPRWNQIITSETILEKEAKTFQVSATDGDLQINADISYKIESDWPEIFKVEQESGIVQIEPINRDEMKKELFSFNLIAYETEDVTSSISQPVTIQVVDKDDNDPLITLDTANVKIDENRLTTLPINIEISDLDLNDNAKYNVWLIDSEFSKAFQIVPNSGYQKATFSISVINAQLLDYENSVWQNFDLTIRSEEDINETKFDEKTIRISLINWNDHEPVFTEIEYNKAVSEDVGINYEIITVKAEDNDSDDKVTYKLLGAENNRLFSIDENGVITTNNIKAFDYEKQNLVFIQIQAEDSLGEPYHKTVVQLIINVEDVNDEQPTISVGPNQISIKENADDQATINENTEISAYDVDTHSQLKFSIDWSNSYGVKNGQTVDVKEWIVVETEFDSTNARAVATLKVVDVIDSGTPDYEVFDTMKLTLVVTDFNQTIQPNNAQVQITIFIEDKNDNDPEFNSDTTSTTRSVVEGALINTTIGTITATDKDGPNHNQVMYSLRPESDKTPNNWIDIDPKSGILFVTGKEKIDADSEKIYELNYIVTAFNKDDENHKNETKITINVIDTNNKTPVCKFIDEISIKEKSKNDFELPQNIYCTDEDRDENYHTVWYRFATTATEIKNLFVMDESTGTIKVAKQDGFELDRDKGQSTYTIPFVVKDNYKQEGSMVQNPFEGSFILILEDINDHSPIIETSNIDGTEDMTKGTVLGEIVASDIDQANTDNSKIKFEILEITKGLNAGNDPPNDLFKINVDDVTSGKGDIIANYDLNGFYGTYTARIEACDLGTDSKCSEKNVTVNISKFNFCPPIFTNPSPSNNRPIYLSKTQQLNQPLVTPNGAPLEDFTADDQQNGKWDIAISIDPSSNTNGEFDIQNLGNSKGMLFLKKMPDTTVQHPLTLLADCRCSGSAPSTANLNIIVRFINFDSEPEFEKNNVTLEFPENDTSIITQQLPKAFFNAESEEWDYPAYYFLDEEGSEPFQINATTAELSLINALDRENQSNWTLAVSASRNVLGNSNPPEKSRLTVFITVTDINDNPPNFDKDEFYAGVQPTNALNTVVVPLTATDLDIDEKLNIIIMYETLESNGNGIENIQCPFYIKSESQTLDNSVIGIGNVHLNFTVQSNMNGYFTFQAKIIDQANHEAVTSVKIYLVSESTEVKPQFSNDLDIVVDKEETIRACFELNVGYRCNIERISPSSDDESGQPIPQQTDVVMHFVNTDTNEAIDSTTMLQLLTDVSRFLKLKKELSEEGLFLLAFDNPPDGSNDEGLLRAWLIGVSVVLGTLCIALIIAFIMKTKSLLNRLNKLSVPEKFGSQESGLNRIVGLTVPNTNKHAEGANPIFSDEKKTPQFDTQSTGSGDSDLIGIEDNPDFDTRRKDSVNSLFKENF